MLLCCIVDFANYATRQRLLMRYFYQKGNAASTSFEQEHEQAINNIIKI